MKTIILSALALAFAVPAAAQTAPAASHPADHSKHEQGKHDCKECCEKMKQQGGMDKADAKSPDAPADHRDHSNH